MKSYPRRQFLKNGALAAAGVSILGQSSALLAHAGPAGASTVTLEYTNRWGKGNDTHFAGMNYLFSTFKAKHPGITINEVVLPAGPDVQKDLADCQAGGCPDMMNDITSTFYDDGYLLDLTPYLNADPAWKATFDQQGLAFTRSNGHQWGLCNEFSPMNAVWNTKVLDAAGVSSIPTTWNALLSACEKIKASGKQPMSWIGLYGGGHFFHNLVAGQSGGLEALAANRFDAPQVTNALTAMKTFVDNKWVASNEIEVTYGQGLGTFQQDQVGFYINGMWTIKNDITGTGISPDLRKHVAFSPVPGLKGGLVV
jgi:ABC-type glycerol-3-phosphate transport system substrate-binding protein